MLGHGTGDGGATAVDSFVGQLGDVLAERSAHYGSPAVNMERTAGILNAVFGERCVRPFTAADVALLLVCVKIARLMAVGDHTDTWLDIAGYAAVGDAAERVLKGGA